MTTKWTITVRDGRECFETLISQGVRTPAPTGVVKVCLSRLDSGDMEPWTIEAVATIVSDGTREVRPVRKVETVRTIPPCSLRNAMNAAESDGAWLWHLMCKDWVEVHFDPPQTVPAACEGEAPSRLEDLQKRIENRCLKQAVVAISELVTVTGTTEGPTVHMLGLTGLPWTCFADAERARDRVISCIQQTILDVGKGEADGADS